MRAALNYVWGLQFDIPTLGGALGRGRGGHVMKVSFF